MELVDLSLEKMDLHVQTRIWALRGQDVLVLLLEMAEIQIAQSVREHQVLVESVVSNNYLTFNL